MLRLILIDAFVEVGSSATCDITNIQMDANNFFAVGAVEIAAKMMPQQKSVLA
jgi:hypothetical protein